MRHRPRRRPRRGRSWRCRRSRTSSPGRPRCWTRTLSAWPRSPPGARCALQPRSAPASAGPGSGLHTGADKRARGSITFVALTLQTKAWQSSRAATPWWRGVYSAIGPVSGRGRAQALDGMRSSTYWFCDTGCSTLQIKEIHPSCRPCQLALVGAARRRWRAWRVRWPASWRPRSAWPRWRARRSTCAARRRCRAPPRWPARPRTRSSCWTCACGRRRRRREAGTAAAGRARVAAGEAGATSCAAAPAAWALDGSAASGWASSERGGQSLGRHCARPSA